MIWLSLLRRFWPFIAGAVLIFSAWLWHLSEMSSARKEGYEQARTEAVAELAAYKAHRDEIEAEVQREHSQTMEDLRKQAARELRGKSIRCVLGDADEVRTGKDTGQPAGSAERESAGGASRNLRAEIVEAGETCERMRQQLIAIRALDR